MKRLSVIIGFLLCLSMAVTAQTEYYKLCRKIVDGLSTTNVSGGQFISFADGKCYESDNEGFSVGHGVLKFQRMENGISVYTGESFWGQSVFKFNGDKSALNVITTDGDVYIYKLSAVPSGVTTCSLIRTKGSNVVVPSGIYIPPIQNVGNSSVYNGNNNTSSSGHASTQKTKVRKNCAYCGGKGETIQHESVATFGLSGPRVYCNKCNQSWSHGTVHAHHFCNHCNGTGYKEYEY